MFCLRGSCGWRHMCYVRQSIVTMTKSRMSNVKLSPLGSLVRAGVNNHSKTWG